MSWKFNPPPGWPMPPDDSWVPPPGWAPDPAWPPAPPGWEFWVPGDPQAPPAAGLPPVDPWPTPPPFQLPDQPAGPAPAGQPPTAPPRYQPATGQPAAYSYPSWPAPPAPPPRRGRSSAIAGAAGAVLLVACTGGMVALAANLDRLDDSGDDLPPTGAPVADSPGWDGCVEAPNTCNSGEVVAGGELVWGAPSADSWIVHTSLGASHTSYQIMAGVAPSVGGFLPDGSWQWNLDLLVEEPALTSEDPQTWQYRIRPEAIWHDGTAITVDDFAFLWRHNSGDPDLCEGCAPASTQGYERIESVTGSDGGQTVTVTMGTDPYPDWRSLFTHLYPAHLAEAAGFDLTNPAAVADAASWFADTTPSWSGGPWQVVAGDLWRQVVLEPNDRWYGQVQPALDRIVFQLDGDPQARQLALAAGQIDGTGPLTDPGLTLDPPPGVLSHIGSSYIWDHLDFNLERPGMDDLGLRRAIFTAIDVDDIIALTYDQPAADTTAKLNHIFKPDSPYYQDHLTGTSQGTGDPAAALAILEEAGYVVDGTQLTKDAQPVGPLVLQHSDGHQRRTIMAELVRDQLAEIGLTVDIQSDQLLTILEEGEYDIVIYGWSGQSSFSRSGYQFWHSDSVGNYGSYQNSEVDRLVLAASTAPDEATAAALLNEANAIVASEAYVLPITHTPVQNLVSDRFRNIRPNPTGTIFYNSHEWGLAAGG